MLLWLERVGCYFYLFLEKAIFSQTSSARGIIVYSFFAPPKDTAPRILPKKSYSKVQMHELGFTLPQAVWGNKLSNASCSHHCYHLIGHRWLNHYCILNFVPIHTTFFFFLINLQGCKTLPFSESPFHLLTICFLRPHRQVNASPILSCNSLDCIKFQILQYKMYFLTTDTSRRGSTPLCPSQHYQDHCKEHVLEVCILGLGLPTIKPHPSQSSFFKSAKSANVHYHLHTPLSLLICFLWHHRNTKSQETSWTSNLDSSDPLTLKNSSGKPIYSLFLIWYLFASKDTLLP